MRRHDGAALSTSFQKGGRFNDAGPTRAERGMRGAADGACA
jgi:hypothetical protein